MASTTLAVLGLCSFTVIMPFCAAQRAPEEKKPVVAPAAPVGGLVDTGVGVKWVQPDKPPRVVEVVPVEGSSLGRVVKVVYDDGTYRLASTPRGVVLPKEAYEESAARDPFQPAIR